MTQVTAGPISPASTDRGWNVGSMWSTNDAGERIGEFQPFKGFSPRGKVRRGEHYGKVFQSREEMDRFALYHGYSRIYHARPELFIKLRLSPATRRYLRPLNTDQRFAVLMRLQEQKLGGCEYLQAVWKADYMAETRAAWMAYIDNPKKS